MASWKIQGIFKGDPNRVYQEINTLDAITPENVLKKARDEKSELHRCFEWNDSIAAEKWRLKQARQIIQLLVVTPRQNEEQPVRLFQISSERNKYEENTFFLQNENEYALLLKRAKAELVSIKNRYKTLSELEEIFDLIDEL